MVWDPRRRSLLSRCGPHHLDACGGLHEVPRRFARQVSLHARQQDLQLWRRCISTGRLVCPISGLHQRQERLHGMLRGGWLNAIAGGKADSPGPERRDELQGPRDVDQGQPLV